MANKIFYALCIVKLVLGKIVVFATLSPASASAEVVPDSTLAENSTVNRQGDVRLIKGGTQRDGNLFTVFRSFQFPRTQLPTSTTTRRSKMFFTTSKIVIKYLIGPLSSSEVKVKSIRKW
jgi:hypothetical protein